MRILCNYDSVYVHYLQHEKIVCLIRLYIGWEDDIPFVFVFEFVFVFVITWWL